ncbi:MAG: ADP-forming succinate--CoA ligase subunit beta [Chloroflexi bacterium]|nr:ADP-forming succinate--CoA ligase subunit beta [Chloroflexota bacterium]
MRLHEYQAKELLAAYGVAVPRGIVAAMSQEVADAADYLGGHVVVKAQVHAGGRGKGGGIKIVFSPQEAKEYADHLLGRSLVTSQTGPEGVLVRRLLVEDAVAVVRELYLSLLIDRSRQRPVMVASEAGGMEIEEVASRTPEKILRVYIDPAVGFQSFQGRAIAYGLNLEAAQIRLAAELIGGVYKLAQSHDCSLVELNPLAVTADGKLLALDAKVEIDDNALYRQRELAALKDHGDEDPLEAEAGQLGVSYIKLDGSIGCMVNGAGLAMATMDMIQAMGAQPANFLDVGGVASPERVAKAFRILISDPAVEAILVNVFGGILRCDIVATGILEATKDAEIKVPLVVRMQGTNVEEGRRLLAESSLPVTFANDLGDAAIKVVAAQREMRH